MFVDIWQRLCYVPLMGQRQRHPKRPIEKALQYAESKGWRIEKADRSGHAWERAFCLRQIAGFAKCQSGLRHEMTKIMPTKSGGAWILVHTVGSNHEIL